MALTIETRTIKGFTYDFIVTRDDGGTLFGLYQDTLNADDLRALNDVDTNGTGADLETKLTGYTLITNGQDGFETYGPLVVNIDNYIEGVAVGVIRGSTPAAIRANEKAIEALDARVTALEP